MRQNFDSHTPATKHQYKKSNTFGAQGSYFGLTPTSNQTQDHPSNFNLRLFGGRKDSENLSSGLQFTAYKNPTENHLSQKYYKNDSLTASRYSYTTNTNHSKYQVSNKADLFCRLKNKSNTNIVTVIRDSSIPRPPQ